LKAIGGWPFQDSIDEAEASCLARDLEKEEVKEVVKAMNGDKVLGPNCFFMAFFQACWVVLKENIMKIFRDFHARGKFERSLNDTFITLIPNIPRAVDLKDLCQLVLWRAFTKLLSRF
jgi:hypothetical protein